MTPTPTPRTDAEADQFPQPGQPPGTPWPEIVPADFARELERELGSPTDAPDANTTAYARVNWWKDRCDDLNNEIADLREGFDAEGRTAAEACCVAFKAEQVERIRQLERELDFSEKTGRQIWEANEQLERELVEARKQIADWQMLLELEVGTLRKELAAERALADSLAETLANVQGDYASTGGITTPEVDEALAAWKEARRDP